MPGPAPKDPETRARRNATVAMTRLPRGGFKGRVPAWPLIDDLRLVSQRQGLLDRITEMEIPADDPDLTATKRAGWDQRIARQREALRLVESKLEMQSGMERKLWHQLWRTPQAAAWELLGWSRDVATYARLSVLAELGDMDALKEARMWSDRLGLTPMAMLRLRWAVATDEVGAARDKQAGAGGSARARFATLKVAGGTDAVAAD